MGGGPGGIGRRGGKGAVDQEPSISRADWAAFPALSPLARVNNGVGTSLFQIWGTRGLGSTLTSQGMSGKGEIAYATADVVGDARTLKSVGVHTQDGKSAGQAVQVWLYRNVPDGFYPGALVWTSGPKDGTGVAGSGTQLIYMGQNLALELDVDVYWFVVAVNAQWATDGRALTTFSTPVRWSPGIFLQTGPGNVNDPVVAQNQLAGWQAPAVGLALSDPFPAGGTANLALDYLGPSVVLEWEP